MPSADHHAWAKTAVAFMLRRALLSLAVEFKRLADEVRR